MLARVEVDLASALLVDRDTRFRNFLIFKGLILADGVRRPRFYLYFIRNLALTWRRAGHQKILPTDATDAMTTGDLFVTRCRDHQRRELWVSATEFEQPLEGLSIEPASFDFNRPLPPASLKNSVDL